MKLRQQQGMTILAKIFDNYKLMKKEIYKRKLEIISRYMPDAQIRKILGETEKYTFQQGYIIDQKRGLIAPIRAVRDLEYNVRIEDAPGGVNKTMAELSMMMEMMQSGMPMDPNTIIDKLDLSPSEKWDWKAYIENEEKQQQQQQQQEMQMKAGEMQIKQKEHQEKMQLEQAKLKISQAKIQADSQTKLQIANQKTQQDDTESKRDYAVKIAELEKAEQEKAFETLVDLARNGLTKEGSNINQKTSTATPATRANDATYAVN